jgi:pimeloyl-ACP methyl ester carboxylesterase
MRRLLPLILFILSAGCASAQSPFTFMNTPGEHGVGVRFLRQYDETRIFNPDGAPGERARPIQTAVWYPAEKGGTPIKYGNYMDLRGWEADFTRSSQAQADVVADWFKFADAIPAAQMAWERRRPMWAVPDAAPRQGRYPVVIYAPGMNGDVFENADMAEYLASHGYIVIASPSLGKHTRAIEFDLEHAELQAADISFLVDYAKSLPQADIGRITAMGYSFGGFSNVLAAARDKRIKALICLDGSLRSHNTMISRAAYAVPEDYRTPLLYLSKGPLAVELLVQLKYDLSGSFISRMKNADVYLLTMYPLGHYGFASSFIRFDPFESDEYSAEEVSSAHSLGARYVLNFLNGYMKNDADGLAYLRARPVNNGVPPHTATMKFSPATSTPK